MSTIESLIERIASVFSRTPYPGDAFLVGSRDGCEPYDVVSGFFGHQDWRALPPEHLDGHYEALSFFSEAGFRYFLPAYLIADLKDELMTADPAAHLTHGFQTSSYEYQGTTRVFVRRHGGDVLLNPRRYGAITWQEYMRCRLSVFCREEAEVIVEYLHRRRERDPSSIFVHSIDAALSTFWLDRARHAPTADQLEAHVQEEREFGEYISEKLRRQS